MFTLDNCKEEAGGKYTCNYCTEAKKQTYKKIKQHFIDKHQKEFDTYFGGEVVWEDAVKNSKKGEKKAKKGGPFGGMPFMDMNAMFGGGMGGMFGGGAGGGPSDKETKEMMKEFEKMMFGGGMGGMGGMPGGMGGMEEMFAAMGGMGGMGGPAGGKKKKKK